jgi:hypothetical protein
VKGLLENSGYHVYAFGYESSISQLRYDVATHKGHVPHNPSNDRMRSMPDLIVHDNHTQQTAFVEIKYRSVKSPERVPLTTKELQWTQTYWNDTVLVVVIPQEHNFYAQKISAVKLYDNVKSRQYNLLKDFTHIENHFQKINPETVSKYKAIREQFLNASASEESLAE